MAFHLLLMSEMLCIPQSSKSEAESSIKCMLLVSTCPPPVAVELYITLSVLLMLPSSGLATAPCCHAWCCPLLVVQLVLLPLQASAEEQEQAQEQEAVSAAL